MAFITETKGGNFTVRNGVNGLSISTHSTKASAEKKLAMLHKKHKPKASNRGKSAARRFKKKR